MQGAGCSWTTLYAVVNHPDKAVKIGNWGSAQARDAEQQNEAWGVFAPLFEMLAGPPRATVVEPLQHQTTSAASGHGQDDHPTIAAASAPARRG